MNEKTTPTDQSSAALPREVQWLRISALLGAAVWFLYALFNPAETDRVTRAIHQLILVGPLVAVPLGLSLVATPDRGGKLPWMYRALPVVQPIGALCTAVALCLPYGLVSASLTVPWIAVTTLVGLYGAWRFWPRRFAPVEELCIDVGLLYLPVGSIWLLFARAEIAPLDFPALIVVLTAAHFHFAGFAAPLITGLTGRTLDASRSIARRAYQISAWAVIIGPPLIAIGITVSQLFGDRNLEVACAFILALGLLVLSVVLIVAVGPKLNNKLAWFLLTIAGLSLVTTMVLACTYALGQFVGIDFVHIPLMARTHGVINVFGFSLAGLIAWDQIRPAPQ